uniref:Golgi-associated plant pathogenesis-related protein 1 n=1 Tax=Equus caballus TaxID=9796 RepID=A0A9L0T059_HORSE
MGKSASKQFNDEVLKAHNEYRRQHGVPPLKLCKKLNREAQQYSEALASTRILKHSPESSRGQCGENLAWASYDQTGKMLETAALLSEAFSNPSGRERRSLIDGTVKSRTTTSSSLASPPGLDTSQPWCGRIQRRWEWGRHLPVTGPPSWLPDTSQQGMLSTRASSKKMSCLQRSNLSNVMGR